MMPSIPIIGTCYSTAEKFLDYLDDVPFRLWRPEFVVVHHCGAPDLKTWSSWQTRSVPVSDEQWLKNLASYYGGLGWNHGPHFMITPKHICVLSPPNVRGTHAVSFNSSSWGVEIVGNFDVEPFEGKIRDMAVGALAAMHVAAGLSPEDYKFNVRGLHFHRDDPLTKKTCPGRNVYKTTLVAAVRKRMSTMTPGDHPHEVISPIVVTPKPPKPDPLPSPRPEIARVGKVIPSDGLAVRIAPSAKSPKLRELPQGAFVITDAYAMNGETKWVRIDSDEWVAARFLDFTR